jgi:cytochrome c-type biogenesis protein CcmH
MFAFPNPLSRRKPGPTDVRHDLCRHPRFCAAAQWIPASAGKSVVAIFVFAQVAFATPALAISDPAEMLPNRAQELRAEAIGSQLRCLVCQNQSIEDSNADLARDLRRIVRSRVAAGDSDKQVIDWVVARYGDFVRLRPPFRPLTWLLWFSPALALGAGTAAVFLARRRHAPPPSPLTDDERAKLAELLRG